MNIGLHRWSFPNAHVGNSCKIVKKAKQPALSSNWRDMESTAIEKLFGMRFSLIADRHHKIYVLFLNFVSIKLNSRTPWTLPSNSPITSFS